MGDGEMERWRDGEMGKLENLTASERPVSV